MQPTHLIIILIVALLIFGPSRLPETGRSLVKTIREFRDATKEATQGMLEDSRKPAEPQKEEPSKAE